MAKPPVRNHIRALMESRARQKLDTFVVQIGAMDGRYDDPIYKAIIKNKWPALLVEPITEYFEILRTNYAAQKNIQFANIAITGYCGETQLHRIPKTLIENGDVPKWAYGASSLYADRNALAWPEIKPHVIEETVQCLTLEALFKQYDVSKCDIFQIDAEGHDYAILKQWDFTRMRPAIINLEIVNLPEEEQMATRALLRDNDYLSQKTGYDLLAVDKHQIHHDDMTGFA